MVEQFTPTATGCTVRFNHAFDPSTFNLYSAADAPMGPPDVLLVGEKVGAISGWIVLDDDLQGFTLIRTGAIRQFTSQHASPELLLRHSDRDHDHDDDDRPPPGSSHLPVGGVLPLRSLPGAAGQRTRSPSMTCGRASTATATRHPGDDFITTFDIRTVGSRHQSASMISCAVPARPWMCRRPAKLLPVACSDGLGGAKSIIFTVDYDSGTADRQRGQKSVATCRRAPA